MSNQISTQTISFNNQALITFEQNGTRYTAMKPICENIGLAWEPQLLRMKRDDILSSTMIITIIVAEDGKNREMVCLPIEYLNGWLFGIDIKRCKPEIRETLIKYKKECYQALHDYWFNGKAERKTTTDERTGLRQAVSALVSKKGLLYSDAYTLIHQRFNIEHIDELTPEQVGMAVEYVHKIYLEGELIIDEPKEEPKLDKETALDLVSSWFALYNSLDLLAQVYRPLELLGSRHGVIAYTHVTEYRNNLSLMKRFLEPMFEGVMLDPFRQAHYFKALKTLREYEPRGFSLATI
ncbi:phage antirepressor N-terminal domain-containing protein [Glaesserella parasuis]|uniref:phage antirepressor N-terminal domain-containing protein n=2 Tax=Glaesserella parasuis TaxID=738 RepID=UPI00243718C6|nr:phage antirepressor N-terminal domain-containing protein [Glaesserella parasuis]MDG6310295.1 phage antirepressor N-terminal domain-containing protein [Glaesserella parasuis]